MVNRKKSSPQQQVVGHLKTIVLYYILCVGGYTAPKQRGQQPITLKKLVNDVTFFKQSKTCNFLSPLPLNAIKQELFYTGAATLCVTEKKKMFKGACTHHRVLERQIFACPVKALARQVAHPMVRNLCVHIETVLAGAMSWIGIWVFIWN